MAGYTTGNTAPETDPSALVTKILAAFVSGGTTVWYTPLAGGDFYSPNKLKRYYLVESTSAVDDYLNTDANQKYRILFTMTYSIPYDTAGATITSMTMTVGNAEQIKPNDTGLDMVVQFGTMGWQVFGSSVVPSATSEFNYRISFTNRGVAMSVWRTNTVNNVTGNFACVIQRPVNPTTGLTKVNGTAPIFALWHSALNESANAPSDLNYFRFGVVREIDKPASVTIGYTNVVSRYNMYRLTLDWSHPNLFDNNSHVVKFPYGLATSRYLYLDELDMICLINATAFAGQQDVGITMYGETAERKYRTTWGEVRYGNVVGVQTPQPKVISGARLGILMLNGGIDAPTP